jgi:hypothetical protein
MVAPSLWSAAKSPRRWHRAKHPHPSPSILPGGEDGIYSGTLLVQTDLQPQASTVTLLGAVVPGPAQTDRFTFEGTYLFLLSGTPDRDGPTLTVNDTVLREGLDWSYDPLTNILAIDKYPAHFEPRRPGGDQLSPRLQLSATWTRRSSCG